LSKSSGKSRELVTEASAAVVKSIASEPRTKTTAQSIHLGKTRLYKEDLSRKDKNDC
jgi:hypothetical protein